MKSSDVPQPPSFGQFIGMIPPSAVIMFALAVIGGMTVFVGVTGIIVGEVQKFSEHRAQHARDTRQAEFQRWLSSGDAKWLAHGMGPFSLQ